jgi:putative kinase
LTPALSPHIVGDTMTTTSPAWLTRIPEFIGPVTLDVAGHTTTIVLAAEDVEHVYLPILAHLTEYARTNRALAALAGIPGSGKSTLVAALAHLADQLIGQGIFAAVGIDGWHLPNVVLDRKTTHDEQGNVIPLRRRKGGPESFDVPAIAAAIEQLAGADQTIRLPVYDRRLHDPRPDGVVITPQTRIVLVEGNYLLDDTPPWNAVSGQLSPKFLLTCDPASARQRVIDRHIRGGCSSTEAERKYEENDALNTAIVLRHAGQADWVVEIEPKPSLRMP